MNLITPYFPCSCFIALWNSLVKAETKDHKGFTIVYSHSLFVCGIVQFLATLFITKEAKENDYGRLMSLFGAILMSASIPVVIIIICNLLEDRRISKSQKKTHPATAEK